MSQDRTTPAETGRELSPIKRALLAVEQMKNRLDAAEYARREPIAIVGIGCRFPGATGPAAYWELLRNGVNAVSEVPPSRWDVAAYFDPDRDAAGKSYTKHGGFLSEVDTFDPQFFGIAPREAVGMDPQQRLLLEVSWEALEDAGQAPERLHGSSTGVYVGIATADYAAMQMKQGDLARLDAYSQSGIAFSIAAGRISYVLGLQGPAVSLDTACSSSLVAVHLACQALRLGECRMALAGGVHLMLLPDNSICFSRARMVAPDGRCKTFDAGADGFVEGEGCAMVVLKRLSDAVADRDRIVAVIRGSAINQDGPSGGLTVPNGPAQEAVIREALARGGLTASRIGYIEAHGTGTSLGDPIEVRALGAVLREGRPAGAKVPIGSVKTNMGHLQGAAGIAGLIKLALALQHREIPPHLHFETPSPHIPWAEMPVTVPTTLTPWTTDGELRAGGVSAFGFSGTNAHVVLEEAPAAVAPGETGERAAHVLTLSARSDTALSALADGFASRIAQSSDPIGDIAFTANTGRSHLSHRLAVTCESRDDLVAALRSLAAGHATPQGRRVALTGADAPKVAFLFTGQGSQAVGMARQLFETQPTFRAALERCDAVLRPHLAQPLLSVLYDPTIDPATINQTAYTQPVLFAVEYALAELWQSWGIKPGALLGHSLGEYVAACVAGVFTLEQALELVATRAQLMQSLPPGGVMSAVLADEATVRDALSLHAPQVSIAAVNGPRQVVVSGAAEAVAAATSALQARHISCEPLTVSHAFHSALMEPILDRFEDAVRRANPQLPQLLVVSNLTGGPVRKELTDPAYWRRHLRETVRFADGVKTLHDSGYGTFVEIGPAATLCAMAQRVLGNDAAYLPSLRRGRADWTQLAATMRDLYLCGVSIDWEGFDRDYSRRRVSLPTYPFERKRYWIEPAAATRQQPAAAAANAHPLLGPAFRTARGQAIFESTINTDTLPYLLDHRKHATTLLPATAYLEIGLAAADELFGRGPHAFDDLVIADALVIPAGVPVAVQTIATPDGPDAAQFELFSRSDNGDWRRHATGMLRKQPSSPAARADLAALGDACPTPLDGGDYYGAMRHDGHEFGPSFQVVRELFQGTRLSLARLQLHAAEAADARQYLVHPALLDGAMQIIGAAVTGEQLGDGETYLPVTFERLTVHRRGLATGWGVARLRQADAATRTLAADIQLLDDEGEIAAVIEGLYLKPIHRDAVSGAATVNTDWLHEVAWTESQLVAEPAPARSWVVFGDGADAAAVCARLRESGHECVRVVRHDVEGGADAIVANPLEREVFAEAYRAAVRQRAVAGAVYMWTLDAAGADDNGDALMPSSVGGVGELLHVVQAIVAAHPEQPPQLSIVSRAAHAVTGSGRAVEQAAAVTLARTISAEYQELRCRCIDLDADANNHDVGALVAELQATANEDLIAYRDGNRFAGRLRQQRPTPEPSVAAAVALDVGTRGRLDTLALRLEPRRAPAAGEVEIRIEAAGLNFRDVLNALGMYEGPAGPLGSEFVGTVVARGSGVTLSVGQRVMGMAAGALRSHLTVAAQDVAAVPAALSTHQAATLPIVFLTALYSLERLARLQRGEAVLIHAGAGGVGLAAIQVAQRLGAEVYATVGSEEKRQYLRALGVRHIFNSRSVSFADDLRAATDGRGVDVVLNSLNGDFIPATLSTLAPNGRFVEIGKAGIWSPEQMAAVRPDVRYYPLYLGDVPPAILQELYLTLADGLSSGVFRPLRYRRFALADAEQAFRFMAQAKHIGKLVLDVDLNDATPIRADATYVVTGAFGGLGKEVARWLVGQGARHLLLLSRQGAASAGASQLLAELTQHGASATAVAVDVADRTALAAALAAVDLSAPVRGVVHAAGVVDDGVLTKMTIERFNTVFAPKVMGAWHLHQLTRDLPLDFFVLFSSMVTVLGAPGQGNYAAANGVLDALAEYRRARGLRATAINWGPWAQAGMTVNVSEEDRQRWQRQGVSMMGTRQGMAILGALLRRGRAQTAVLPIQWRLLLQKTTGPVPPFFSELASRYASDVASEGVDLIAELAATPAVRRQQVVTTRLTALAGKVLGLDNATVFDPQRPLQEYGLDSLMAVELRNGIGAMLARTLPATLLFKYPTLHALTGFVLESVPPAGDEAPAVSSSNGDAEAEAIGAMNEDDVRRLLAEELETLSSGTFGTS